MTYRVRFHPVVEQDLEAIAQWIIEYAGSEVADREIAETELEIASLARTLHRGSIRAEIAPGLRAIPAGRRAVITFSVDDDAKEVLIHCVTYSGGDWATRSRERIV